MELDLVNSDAGTEVGSYFVSNYPPYSAWKQEHVPSALATLSASASPESDERSAAGNEQSAIDNRQSTIENAPPPLGLYLHIPFCRKRCKFCYFRVYTDKNARDVDAYMDALANEIALYSDKARLTGREFEFVYFGGGTPSFLSSAQLERLIERINKHWRWDAAREVTFECEPGTLRRSKLETIKRIGVTRISLGVEHFDDDVLEANGRAHKSPEIFRAYDWIREIGFPQVNIDLIAGMVGETEEKWKSSVQKALELAPDSLTVYQMELPYNTVFTRETQDAGGQSPVADWTTKRRWVAYAFDLFERAGYVVSSGYTVAKPGEHDGFVYRDALWRGADMVGTGVASISHVGGMHYQNLDAWGDYLAAIARGELPLARALPIAPEQRLIRELILQIKFGRLDAGYFREKFAVEILERFAAEFASIVSEGMGEIQGDKIDLTRAGLLRVDGLLKRFFEPQFRDIRYT